jgi:hypothetical protein
MKLLILALLAVVLGSVEARAQPCPDGFRKATNCPPEPVAQTCPPDSHVFIDPRLAPRRVQVDRRRVVEVMASSRLPDWLKKQVYDQHMARDQPFYIPFGNGTVWVHPTNPCIQQYIEGK